MAYSDVKMEKNPVALSILYKVQSELVKKGLVIEERVSKGYKLPFDQPLNRIVISAKWLDYIMKIKSLNLIF